MTCRDSIGFDALLAYWLGELPAEREAALEEHLFACASCTQRLEGIVALAGGVRVAVAEGRIALAASEAFITAMREAGMRVREYHLAPGGSVNCTIRSDDDALVSRISAPLANVRRLDVVFQENDGPEKRLADVPFDAAAGEVLLIPSATALRAMPAHTLRLRLLAVDEAGETSISDYTFNHSRS